jgi:hypothetical protein
MKYVKNIESAFLYDALPDYSFDGIKYLYEKVPGLNKNSVIADIASGTGKLTRSLLKMGSIVYGIEPDDNMRSVCERNCKKYKNFNNICGTAQKTNLANQSVDFVTTAQSFHLFNLEDFRRECDRILKKPNNIIIIWDRYDFTLPVLSEMLEAFKISFKKYKLRYKNNNVAIGFDEEVRGNRTSVHNFFNQKSKMLSFNNDIYLTDKQFLKLCESLQIFPIAHFQTSTSLILKSPDFNYKKYRELIKAIFKNHNKNGLIKIPITTEIFLHKSLLKHKKMI